MKIEAKRYQATVPDTLDLAERAELALNGLSGTLDPEGDHQMYFFVFCNTNPPWMEHGGSDSPCMPKYAISKTTWIEWNTKVNRL